MIRRYEDLPTEEAFDRHVFTGEPFIVNIPPSETHGEMRISSLDEWINFLQEKWNNNNPDDIQPRYDRVPIHQLPFCYFWTQFFERITFENMSDMARRWPKLYISMVANERDTQELINSVFTAPFPLPRRGINTPVRWMYGGRKGAGVQEHVDYLACSCTWSFMLFGEKKWWVGTPEGFPEDEAYNDVEVVQGPGDFFFWCEGYRHGTLIETPESLDVHGYVNFMDDRADSYYERLLAARAAASSVVLTPEEYEKFRETCDSQRFLDNSGFIPMVVFPLILLLVLFKRTK
ncbi:hypothetical protein TrCOL_g11817 [Triparma columacea]|uniref:Uncharacterized protein n=1 Tax=Triparma columacea TaxID=722753 RepID=A0A9W7G3N0_9STRA|nr:hypothetical protein TrCOL_g11817 [Triparma columacea]